MSDSEFDCTPPEVVKIAADTVENLLPTKSSSVYESAFKRFQTWCDEKKTKNYSENVIIAYFSELKSKQNMKSSTMWSQYSMVRSILNLRHGIDISKYLKLRAYLKKQNEGYVPKKARVLTREEFDSFITEAPDEVYLGIKIVLVIGISGACRCEELVKMTVDNIRDLGSAIHIIIPDNKTKKPRSFTIVGEEYLSTYRKYVFLRPKDLEERRFFLKYDKGRCCRMVMGIHKISSVPKQVATFLKLPFASEYTGHCLRRTSATLLVDTGADITCLKRHGGWKSSTVAEGYIEESMTNKKEIANKILQPKNVDEPNETNESNNFNIEINSSATGSASSRTIPDVIASIPCGLNFSGARLNNNSFYITFKQ